jgi:6-phosphogluconolactonase
MMPGRTDYPTREAQAEGLAALVADQLSESLAGRERAALALSGGNTPGRFMDVLSQADLDWSRVDVTLSDERWVPHASDRSNFGLLRRAFLKNRAKAATAVSLYRPVPAPEDALDEIEAAISPLLPLDVCVLGMGADGHTASLFPDGDRLAEALSETCPDIVLSMRAPAAPEPRITLTAPVFTRSRHIHLLLTGKTKDEALTVALRPGSAAEAPVRIVLGLATTHVHYAP